MLKQNFGTVAMSLVEIMIGILLLVNPIGFTSGIVVIFGVVLSWFGLWNVIKYFRTEAAAAAAGQYLVKGTVMLLTGLFFALNAGWFLATFPVLTLAYGVVILVTGITKVQWTLDMIRMKRGRWFWMALSAVVFVICGITVVTNPFSSTAVLWMFIGISLIVEAVLDMVGSIFGNREKKGSAAAAQAECE